MKWYPGVYLNVRIRFRSRTLGYPKRRWGEEPKLLTWVFQSASLVVLQYGLPACRVLAERHMTLADIRSCLKMPALKDL